MMCIVEIVRERNMVIKTEKKRVNRGRESVRGINREGWGWGVAVTKREMKVKMEGR